MVSLNTATGEDISDLKKLISTNEDTHMNSKDLAFFLATHNYNAMPDDGYAELNLNGKIYKLVHHNASFKSYKGLEYRLWQEKRYSV